MVLGGPAAHVGADLGDQLQRGLRPDGWIWLRSAPPVSTCSGVRMSKAGACFLVLLARGAGSAAAGGPC